LFFAYFINKTGGIDMKRIKAACIYQTLHFQLKEDLEHSIAVRLVREEVEHYKQVLERNRTRHKIVDEAEQEDGSVVILIIKQYNRSPVGDYLD
jgi:succinyl-CoA synthetase beta subunit